MIKIKSRWGNNVRYTAVNATNIRGAVREAVESGAPLYEANLSGMDLSGMDLSGVNLSGTNLYGTNLSGTKLYGTNLSRANLYRANLSETNLCGANLSGANLYESVGINKYMTTPLYMLLDQTGKIRAYKLVDSDYRSPLQWTGKLTYRVGSTVEVPDASTDEYIHCAAGINVATLDWCIQEWRTGYRILVVEFARKDIACIPVGSDGKFRLHRCKIVAEKDLAVLGLAAENEADTDE